MAPLIQWEGWLHKLIKKIYSNVDLEGWAKKLGRSGDGWLMKGPLRDKLWYKIVLIRLDQSCNKSYDLRTL